MPVSDLSTVAQDYLKVIWSATEWSETPITVKQLAERLGVRAATISDGIRRLVDQGMLVHEPYGGIELTETGRHHAVAMVRRHRLLETFLVEELGYGWDEVHDEAEVLEHAVSDGLIDRIDRRLGFPSRDPHGDPIPTADGTAHRPDATPLLAARTGVRLTVSRISDAEPAILRYLAERGIVPDAELSVDEHREFAGDVTVRLGDAEIVLGQTAAGAVWVAGD
ncbi:DtxR family transcriptional regulator [Leifsonia sp. Root227]|jgi:DtxR family Mn-dependent transcriptional regulator|uniref:metal-dependent transcriptional regulator n=1 Tax=Leifsonia sp. Root227 TaxID=1736496 RepID=UPI00070153CF|nr:metal-dependent transcriptional regulator [Leifsonia sp. Root227]KRC52040.1 DtxR family transcriptional regulator [Leifsonia sp. Root227]